MRARGFAWVTAALCATSLDSMAQPAATASATRNAIASASASAAAKVEIPPWPASRDAFPAFDAEPFADEKTRTPDDEDWKKAVQVRLSRVSPAVPAACRAWRVREWMKIHCDIKTAGLRLLAGNTDGVSLVVAESLAVDKKALAAQLDMDESEVPDWQISRQRLETMGRFAQIIFPVRRGDRRVFEWLRLDLWEEYDGGPGIGATSTMIVEELWLEGEKPQIALLTR